MGRAPVTLGRASAYPHVLEHDGQLVVVFSRNKRTVEIVRVPLAGLERLRGRP